MARSSITLQIVGPKTDNRHRKKHVEERGGGPTQRKGWTGRDDTLLHRRTVLLINKTTTWYLYIYIMIHLGLN